MVGNWQLQPSEWIASPLQQHSSAVINNTHLADCIHTFLMQMVDLNSA